jgi:hypothetical protein
MTKKHPPRTSALVHPEVVRRHPGVHRPLVNADGDVALRWAAVNVVVKHGQTWSRAQHAADAIKAQLQLGAQGHWHGILALVKKQLPPVAVGQGSSWACKACGPCPCSYRHWPTPWHDHEACGSSRPAGGRTLSSSLPLAAAGVHNRQQRLSHTECATATFFHCLGPSTQAAAHTLRTSPLLRAAAPTPIQHHLHRSIIPSQPVQHPSTRPGRRTLSTTLLLAACCAAASSCRCSCHCSQ